MRLIWFTPPLLLLSACKDTSSTASSDEPEPEPRISYSSQIRPLLINNCVSCHADFPLHNPEGWDLLHQHEGKLEIPDLFKKWVKEGKVIDPHWAGLPLRKISGDSVDNFLEAAPELEKPREVPQAMFTASVPELLAGDLMTDKMKTISTGYLRQGDDTPEWRAEMVAKEFLGVRADCAKCHDHPSEHWTKERYTKLAELFTTPYDHLPKALPPLFVKVSEEESQKIDTLKKELEEASKETQISEQDYSDWLALDEGTPSIPGLVAAYSFEDGRLSNLASQGQVKAEGRNLIAEESAHGRGLFFDGENELILTDLPGGSELDRFTISTWIKLEPEALLDTPITAIGTRERGFEFRVTKGKLQARWTRFWPQMAVAVTSRLPLMIENRWCHVAVSYDGTRLASGFRIYLNGLPIEVIGAPIKLMKSVLPQNQPLIVSGKGLSLDELQIYDNVLTPIGIRQLFDGRTLVTAYQDGSDLRKFYQRHLGKGEPSRRMRVRTLSEEILQVENQLPAYLVMAGNPDREVDEDSKEPANRLEFAQRLNKNLLARSLANEVWRRHFGVPLAHSLGFSDPLPDHPDLLEWLAGKLQENNFNIAKLGELIRSSKAWTQEWAGPEKDAALCPRPAE